jgi:hypothetical protein
VVVAERSLQQVMVLILLLPHLLLQVVVVAKVHKLVTPDWLRIMVVKARIVSRVVQVEMVGQMHRPAEAVPEVRVVS